SFCIPFPAWNQFIAIISIAAGLLAIIMNIILLSPKASVKNNLPKRSRQILLVAGIAFSFLSIAASTNDFDPFYHAWVPARIEAPPMRFTFWSQINISYFEPAQWQQLDDHGVILVPYGLNKTTNDTFTWAQYLRDNYHHIKLMWPLFGGYYDTCHDYAQEIEPDTNNYLDAIQAYNLNNTVGFVFDLERCNDTCWQDAVKWQDFQASMERCFSAIRAANASYRIDNTAGIWMMYSHVPLGGGNQTEILFQHAVMSLDATANWSGYQWQLYRGNANTPASDPDSTNMYERMLSSVRGVGASKTVPLFGMTGVGDYGPNNCTVDAVPCNFAGVVKDCRLARSLGITEVGFYTLCDAGVWESVYYPNMFEAYGNTFLDVLNASVNGLNESMVIDVPGNTAFRTTIGYYWEFVSYNINGYACAIIIIASVVGALILDYYRDRARKNDL
nr:hypothetical protein [Candidatus Sigynarchaeota archaeon]